VSPAQPDAGVVGFTIRAGGQSVEPEVHEQVTELVVDARLRVPDRLTLRLRDDGTTPSRPDRCSTGR
jgi:hypothetical protein